MLDSSVWMELVREGLWDDPGGVPFTRNICPDAKRAAYATKSISSSIYLLVCHALLIILAGAWQLKSESSQNGVILIAADKSQKASSTNTSTDSSGSRAGLFRTPISGGVQSATFAHGLPPPALAVRNLMEQVAAASKPLELSCTRYGVSCFSLSTWLLCTRHALLTCALSCLACITAALDIHLGHLSTLLMIQWAVS